MSFVGSESFVFGETPRRSPLGRPAAVLIASVAVLLGPFEARAQFDSPCESACAAALFGVSFVVATGSATAVGRANGGYGTAGAGLRVWAGGFAAAAVAGVALSGDGVRQRRAIYSAGIGALSGSLLGLAIESALGESSSATRLAGTLIGAAAGAIAGGVVGALTAEDRGSEAVALSVRMPALTFRIGL